VRHRVLASAAVAMSVAALASGCLGQPADRPTGRLAVDVAPLNLSGVTDADYTLEVFNGPGAGGELVWTKDLRSSTHGDGAGSLSYVGTCDAATGTNTVRLTLGALYDGGGEVPVGTYMNPTPIDREIDCRENADVAVTFDIALARQADQGFFDIAVQFSDIFCSAKLDCERDDHSDLELLHAPGGERDMTVVVGFACTGSLSGTTFLYMDDVVVDCAGQALDVRVDPSQIGNVTPTANPGGYLFGAAVYRGVEGFAGKAYWNVALGLDATTFAANGTCVLTGRATASDEAFPQQPGGFPLPAGTVYPVIDWSVTLSNASGRVCTQHEVNGGDGVATNYLGYLPLLNGFTWSPDPIYMQHRLQPETGVVLSAGAPICNPVCEHGACVADGPGTACDCAGTGYSGATCGTPDCSAGCGTGTCVAPETCDCDGTGFSGASCETDVDECAVGNGGCAQTCTNDVGSYVCSCAAGYTLNVDGHGCDDVNECDTANGGCDQTCTNDVGSYVCSCAAGYTLNADGHGCDDVNECDTGNGGCAQTCTNDVGSYVCSCGSGYTLNVDGHGCDDVNECATANGGCAQTCTNDVGSYVCSCGSGYTLNADGHTCDDVNECATANGGCAQTCTNDVGSYVCSCGSGYTLNADGHTCDDVNECDTANGGCAQTCTNDVGSYVCSCAAGYTLNADGHGCDDVNECDTANGGCAQTCTNDVGSYVCSCAAGYTLNADGHGCDDVNECDTANGGCAQTCTNDVGSYVCSCAAGYTLNADGHGCDDVNECDTANGGCDQTCTNDVGSYVCSCAGGYTLNADGHTCDDVNECDTGNGGCAQTCTNDVGSYVCSCGSGYTLNADGHTCDDVNECDTANGGCDQTCTNDAGSYVCSCGSGYTLNADGHTCDDVNECATANGGCAQTCTNDVGSYVCSCGSGYVLNGDGHTCDDVNECDTANGGCAQTCTNSPGSYACACTSGFVLSGDGVSCDDVDGCVGAPCGAVTCHDVPAPGTGYTCATPDATSGLSCSPTSLTIGGSATCTITPREGGVVISAPASAFAPSASSGSVSGVSPSVGTSLTFTFTAAYAGTITIGDGLSTTSVGVSHATTAGTTPSLAGVDCEDLLAQGVVTSGTYWIDPTGAAPVEVYCEQQRYGGGWILLYNSVGDPGGQTLAFWNIGYADRLARKGTPAIDQNFYDGDLYRYGRTYLDVAEDLTGAEAEIFRATAAGIDEVTMAMYSPALVSGNSDVFLWQFAAGWSSPDRDFDTSTSSCAAYYANVTQHYAACWRYNLGADADTAADPTYQDGGWGPHMYAPEVTGLGLTAQSGGGSYSRMNRLSRFVKLCSDGGCTPPTAAFDCQELYDLGETASGTYWITGNGSTPYRTYCEQVLYGGGWTLLYNSVGELNGPTRAFWTIAYADRWTRKGAPSLNGNWYDPALYTSGGTYLDVGESTEDGGVAELFTATASGIDATTMALQNPAQVSGSSGIYYHQFAAGWSSPDQDYDPQGANCAASYGTTQHYGTCWVYNLGSDANTPYADSDWGPHISTTYADTLGLAHGDDGTYTRLARISRFVRPHRAPVSCYAWRQLGYTTTGTYLVDPDGAGSGEPFNVHCDMTWKGGGWTRIYYQDANAGFFTENEFTKNKSTPDAALYAILDDLEGFRRDGAFELAMFWPGGSYTLPQHWSQTSNPVTDAPGAIPTGVVAIEISYTSNTSASGWAGLQRNGSSAGVRPSLLDGTMSPLTNWYYAVGTTSCWGGPEPYCQPGPGSGGQRYAELWVR